MVGSPGMLSNSIVIFSFLFLSVCTVFDWSFSLYSASTSGGMQLSVVAPKIH
jgi:hypothetical protein